MFPAGTRNSAPENRMCNQKHYSLFIALGQVAFLNAILTLCLLTKMLCFQSVNRVITSVWHLQHFPSILSCRFASGGSGRAGCQNSLYQNEGGDGRCHIQESLLQKWIHSCGRTPLSQENGECAFMYCSSLGPPSPTHRKPHRFHDSLCCNLSHAPLTCMKPNINVLLSLV